LRALAATLLVALGAEAREAPPRDVFLTVKGTDAERKHFTDSLGELVGRLGQKLQAERTYPLATVEADFSEASEVVLTVQNSDGKVVLLRRLPRGEKPAVAIEAAAHVAHAVVEELLAVARRAPLKSDGPAPAPDPVLTVAKPRPAGRENDAVAFELGGYANTRIWGGGAPFTAGFGVQLALALAAPRVRPALALSLGYQPPFEVSNDYASMLVHALPLRLLAQLTPVRGDNWRLDAALGGGADVFVTATRTALAAPNAAVLPQGTAAPVLTAQLTGRFGLVRSADLWLGVMADVDLAPRRFVVAVGNTSELLYQPWRVRPSIMLGFSLAPVGREPYAGRAEETP
jgi:hypothetical protein